MNTGVRFVGRCVTVFMLALIAGGFVPIVSIAPAHAMTAPAIPLAWGYNAFGQLGNGSATESPVPLPIAVDTSGVLQGRSIAALAPGYLHSLALDTTGAVFAWGSNSAGQLGNGSQTQSPVPTAVDTTGYLAGKTITAIAAGGFHSLALDSTGLVYAWGANDRGQIGNDSVPQSFAPMPVFAGGALSGRTITAIAAGSSHSLALDSSGQVYAWGDNTYGQLGNATQTSGGHAVAVDTSGVLAGKTIVAIAAGGNHSLALDNAGQVYAWGDNEFGQLGNNSANQHSLVPVAVDTSGVLAGKTITAIAAGGLHSLALDSTGHVSTWGAGGYGQLGNADTGRQLVPVAVNTAGVLAGKIIVAIAGGYDHSLALDSSGAVYAWGYGGNGQLGNGGSGASNVPVATSLPTTRRVTALGVGSLGFHTLALAGTSGPTWDYDIALTEVATPVGSTIIAEGWLHTVPDPKDPANSIGTFTDNLAGGKTYPVTYSSETQQLTLNTIYGTFILKHLGDIPFYAVSYPTRFGASHGFVINAFRPHHDYETTYINFSAFPAAGVGPLITGRLSLTLDIQSYLVPDSLKAHITSRLVGTIGAKPFVAPITHMGFFHANFGTSGQETLVFSLKIAGQVYRFQGSRVGGEAVGGIAYADGATKYGVLYTWVAR